MSVKTGVMQPYFIPYIGYFQLINAVDKYVIYDDVQFIKRGWINRNNILLNGQSFLFSLMLSGASQNKLINEIEVLTDQTKFIKTIESAYKKAPYYDVVFPLLLEIINFNDKNLSQYIGNSISKIVDYLSIETELLYSSSIEKRKDLRAQDKIIDICKRLNTSTYINAIGGMELYDKDFFKKEDIDLKFLKSNRVEYKQFKNEFIANLSIIDVIMFNPVDDVKTMLNDYTLI